MDARRRVPSHKRFSHSAMFHRVLRSIFLVTTNLAVRSGFVSVSSTIAEEGGDFLGPILTPDSCGQKGDLLAEIRIDGRGVDPASDEEIFAVLNPSL